MIRISGIVKTANQVKQQLQQGIHPQEILSFKNFVLQSLQNIERICQDANTTPDLLPSRSRKAYYYLKTLNLNNLPLTQDTQVTTSIQTLQIKNIVTQHKNIQQKLRNLVPNYALEKLSLIHQTLLDLTREIELICQQNHTSPAALATPSRKCYSWMKFLSNFKYLQLHFQALLSITELWHKTISTHELDSQALMLEISNYNGLYKYRHNRHKQLEIILSEGFIQANSSIFQALINMILLGNNPQDKQIIFDYSHQDEYQNITLELDLIADFDAEKPEGNFYNLNSLFHSINQDYFNSKMSQPRLTWNNLLTFRKLGHYEPLRDRVVISRTLDNSHVPQFVVEFVLYHELLHKHHGEK